MEPFKNLINADLVRATGHHLQRVDTGFDRAGFEARALDGLEALELKARAMHLATALQATLPADFDAAMAHIEAALAPPVAVDGTASLTAGTGGLAGWVVWPLGEFVVRQANTPDGRHVARALQGLHALTQRFSAEYAIRPFLRDHPGPVFETLRRWTTDDSAHVRRLVSEGSRPRLPWGLRLAALVADPRPTLPLLQALQDDPSATVRRSVANHLNDIARDHPQRVADWLHTHLPQAPPARRALLRHACRTLIKQGDAQVLTAWGLGAAFQGTVHLALSPVPPAVLMLGDRVALCVSLQAAPGPAQDLVIDYVIHHVKADGSTAPKVFKGWTRTLAGGEAAQLRRQHAVRPITTRRYHAGLHRVDLRVNGRDMASAGFDLRLT